MFQYSRDRLGTHDLIHARSLDGDTAITLAPGRGGSLISLRLSGIDLLDGYQTAKELDSLDWAKSGLLFPFPNRLQDGKYQWEGSTYTFPQNEVARGNAIHGFGLETSFHADAILLEKDCASIQLRYRFEGLPYYPFPFLLVVRYELHVEGRLELHWSVENRGQKAMPFAWGWHPYFKLGGDLPSWSIQLSPCRRILVNERMLPTGREQAFPDFAEDTPIQELQLDDCFRLNFPGSAVRLSGPNGMLEVAAGRDQGFFQLFIPPMRKSVAIEPMWGNINCFRTGDGLLTIQAGEIRQSATVLRFERTK